MPSEEEALALKLQDGWDDSLETRIANCELQWIRPPPSQWTSWIAQIPGLSYDYQHSGATSTATEAPADLQSEAAKQHLSLLQKRLPDEDAVAITLVALEELGAKPSDRLFSTAFLQKCLHIAQQQRITRFHLIGECLRLDRSLTLLDQSSTNHGQPRGLFVQLIGNEDALASLLYRQMDVTPEDLALLLVALEGKAAGLLLAEGVALWKAHEDSHPLGKDAAKLGVLRGMFLERMESPSAALGALAFGLYLEVSGVGGGSELVQIATQNHHALDYLSSLLQDLVIPNEDLSLGASATVYASVGQEILTSLIQVYRETLLATDYTASVQNLGTLTHLASRIFVNSPVLCEGFWLDCGLYRKRRGHPGPMTLLVEAAYNLAMTALQSNEATSRKVQAIVPLFQLTSCLVYDDTSADVALSVFVQPELIQFALQSCDTVTSLDTAGFAAIVQVVESLAQLCRVVESQELRDKLRSAVGPDATTRLLQVAVASKAAPGSFGLLAELTVDAPLAWVTQTARGLERLQGSERLWLSLFAAPCRSSMSLIRLVYELSQHLCDVVLGCDTNPQDAVSFVTSIGRCVTPVCDLLAMQSQVEAGSPFADATAICRSIRSLLDQVEITLCRVGSSPVSSTLREFRAHIAASLLCGPTCESLRFYATAPVSLSLSTAVADTMSEGSLENLSGLDTVTDVSKYDGYFQNAPQLAPNVDNLSSVLSDHVSGIATLPLDVEEAARRGWIGKESTKDVWRASAQALGLLVAWQRSAENALVHETDDGDEAPISQHMSPCLLLAAQSSVPPAFRRLGCYSPIWYRFNIPWVIMLLGFCQEKGNRLAQQDESFSVKASRLVIDCLTFAGRLHGEAAAVLASTMRDSQCMRRLLQETLLIADESFGTAVDVNVDEICLRFSMLSAFASLGSQAVTDLLGIPGLIESLENTVLRCDDALDERSATLSSRVSALELMTGVLGLLRSICLSDAGSKHSSLVDPTCQTTRLSDASVRRLCLRLGRTTFHESEWPEIRMKVIATDASTFALDLVSFMMIHPLATARDSTLKTVRDAMRDSSRLSSMAAAILSLDSVTSMATHMGSVSGSSASSLTQLVSPLHFHLSCDRSETPLLHTVLDAKVLSLESLSHFFDVLGFSTAAAHSEFDRSSLAPSILVDICCSIEAACKLKKGIEKLNGTVVGMDGSLGNLVSRLALVLLESVESLSRSMTPESQSRDISRALVSISTSISDLMSQRVAVDDATVHLLLSASTLLSFGIDAGIPPPDCLCSLCAVVPSLLQENPIARSEFQQRRVTIAIDALVSIFVCLAPTGSISGDQRSGDLALLSAQMRDSRTVRLLLEHLGKSHDYERPAGLSLLCVKALTAMAATQEQWMLDELASSNAANILVKHVSGNGLPTIESSRARIGVMKFLGVALHGSLAYSRGHSSPRLVFAYAAIDAIQNQRQRIMEVLRCCGDMFSASSVVSLQLLRETAVILGLISELCTDGLVDLFQRVDVFSDILKSSRVTAESICKFLGASALARDMFQTMSDPSERSRRSLARAMVRKLSSSGIANARHEAIRLSHLVAGAVRVTSQEDSASAKPFSASPVSSDTTSQETLEKKLRASVSSDIALKIEREASTCLLAAMRVLRLTHPAKSAFLAMSSEEVRRTDLLRLARRGAMVAFRYGSTAEPRFGSVLSVDTFTRSYEVSLPFEGDGSSTVMIQHALISAVEDTSKRLTTLSYRAAPETASEMDDCGPLSLGHLILGLRWCFQTYTRSLAVESPLLGWLASSLSELLATEVSIHRETRASSVSKTDQLLEAQLLDLFGSPSDYGMSELPVPNATLRHGIVKDIVDDECWDAVRRLMQPHLRSAAAAVVDSLSDSHDHHQADKRGQWGTGISAFRGIASAP